MRSDRRHCSPPPSSPRPLAGEATGSRRAEAPAGFTTTIDNPYWPMRPGTRWVYRETERDGSASASSSPSPTAPGASRAA